MGASHHDTLSTLLYYAKVLVQLGKQNEALSHCINVHDLLVVKSEFGFNELLMQLKQFIGQILIRMGRPKEAVVYLLEVVEQVKLSGSENVKDKFFF